MANQIVVSAGAKVRNLSGVLTATSGVVSFLPIDVSLGIPQLDVNGKILVSQLPNSVMEYKGTWSAATNTPTLANGTGNQGDVYLCNVAGTVDFGAGPIAFFVGDQVIYSGSIWQRASGASGTVTSVAVTESGDSLNITGSPITTSGTINIGFNGTNLQYVNGAGNLTTFPTLTGYVPYTGATQDVDLGAFKLNAQSLHIKGTAGNGHLGLKHQSASATASANEVSLFADSLGDLSWLNGNLYLSKFITSGNTAARSYTFPNATCNIPNDALVVHLAGTETITGAKTFNATLYGTDSEFSGSVLSPIFSVINGTKVVNLQSLATLNRDIYLPDANGTVALTSDISYPVTSVFGRTGAVVATSGDYTTAQVTESGSLYFTDSRARLAISLTTTGTSGAATYNNTTGVFNIPNYAPDLSGYVTLATAQTISGAKTFTSTITATQINLGGGAGQNQLQSAANNDFILSNSGNFRIINNLNTVALLTITNAGASTFTGSLTAGGLITGQNGIYQSNPSSSIASNKFETYNGGATPLILDAAGASASLDFRVTGSTKLNIDSSGRTSIGYTTNPSIYQLDVNGTGRFSGNLQVGGSAISGNSSSFYNTAAETSVAIKQTSGATILALSLWNNSTTGDSRFLRFFTEATATYRGSIQYDRPGDRLAIYGGGSGLFFDGAATFSSSVRSNDQNAFQLYQAGNPTDTKLWSIQNLSSSGQLRIRAGNDAETNGINAIVISRTGISSVSLDFNGAATFSGALNGTSASFSGAMNADSYGMAGAVQAMTWTTNTLRLGQGSYWQNIELWNGTTQVLKTLVNGNVGIGTSTISSTYGFTRTLAVSNPTNAELQLEATTSGRVLSIGITDGMNYFQTSSSNGYDFQTGTTSKMRITSGGNVGIGTTTPLSLLHIASADTDQGIRLTRANGTYGIRITRTGQIQGKLSDDTTFQTAISLTEGNTSGSQYLALQPTGGNVLIGTTTDSGYKLDVNGTGRFSGVLNVFSTGSTQLFLKSTGGGSNRDWQFQTNETAAGDISLLQSTTAGGATYATKFNIGATGAATFSSTVSATSYNRASAGTGFLNGKYAGVETTATTGPIYCIGDSYVPTSTSLNTMYGIGYSYNNFTGKYGPANTWGMYVAGGGTANVFLAAGGEGYFGSTVTASGFFESSDSRLKTLIEDNYQTKGIGEITPKLYTKNGKVELGYYAQDFIGILDSAISKIDDGMLNLSYREVHTAKIYALEQEIKELKAKMN